MTDFPCLHEKTRSRERNGVTLDVCLACGSWRDAAGTESSVWMPAPLPKKAKAVKKPKPDTIVVVRRKPEDRASWMYGARYVLKAIRDDKADPKTIEFALNVMDEIDAQAGK